MEMKKIDLNKEAPSEYAFRIYKGEKILSLRQLRDALETMEDPVFAHHVNEQRNDLFQQEASLILPLVL